MTAIMTAKQSGDSLIRKVRKGDRAAFDTLIARLEERVRAFVHSRLRGGFRQRANVDEIVQDTFVRAFQSIGSFRGEDFESFVPWIMGVARIAVIKAASGSPRESGLEIPPGLVGNGVSPSRELRRHERFDRLQGALDSLGAEYREVIYLSRIEGLSLGEIAARMDRSPEAVRKLFGRALRKLRERVSETESLHLPDRQLRYEGDDHD